jgi:hypothetical protein
MDKAGSLRKFFQLGFQFIKCRGNVISRGGREGNRRAVKERLQAEVDGQLGGKGGQLFCQSDYEGG